MIAPATEKNQRFKFFHNIGLKTDQFNLNLTFQIPPCEEAVETGHCAHLVPLRSDLIDQELRDALDLRQKLRHMLRLQQLLLRRFPQNLPLLSVAITPSQNSKFLVR